MAIGSDELLDQRAAPAGRRPRRFLLGAAAAAAVVFIGFSQTYYLKALFGTPALALLVHLHGIVMTLWFAILLVQVLLVARGDVRTHRRLGKAGAVVAALVVAVGIATAINAARLGVTPGPPPLVFLAIPLGDMVLFALLAGLGLAWRARPDVHKRLMLMASLGILTAAIARLPIPGGLPAFFAATDVLILAVVAVDTVRHRRLHPAFGWGFAAVLASQVGRFLVAGTPEWTRFATWLVS